MMKKKGMILTLGFVLFIIYNTYLLLSSAKYACEVCILYNDIEVCQKVTGMDRKETVVQGVNTACGGAANGRAQNIECSNTPPKSVQCRELG